MNPQKRYNIPVIIPHDDAYSILSRTSQNRLIPLFRSQFGRPRPVLLLVEPLLSTIVDRAAEPDAHWPSFLSALVQAGMVEVLARIALLPLPGDLGHPNYRKVQEAKRDALVAIVRALEQISTEDMSGIDTTVVEIFRRLATDEAEPLSVQWQAEAALKTWKGKLRASRLPSGTFTDTPNPRFLNGIARESGAPMPVPPFTRLSIGHILPPIQATIYPTLFPQLAPCKLFLNPDNGHTAADCLLHR